MSGFLGMFAASGGISTPAAPTIGTATAISSTSATVAFTAGGDGGSPILDYTVTASPGGITATGSSSPITVIGLTSGASYTFTVAARNLVGTGLSSASSSPATRIWSVPDAPTIGTATAGGAGTLQATVTFTPPVWGGGTAITSYTVRSSGGQSATGSGSPITVTGLNGNTDYTFTVSATNSVGEGAQSSSSNIARPLFSPISASGGGTIYDGTGSFAGYRFHVFNSPGTFTVGSNQGNLTFDILAVGAGGGNNGAGNGGAGGGGQINEYFGQSIPTSSPVGMTISSGTLGPQPGSFPASIGAAGTTFFRPTPGPAVGTSGGAARGSSIPGGFAGGISGNGNSGGTPGADNNPFNTINRWGGGGGGGNGGGGNAGNKADSPPAQDPRPSPDPGAGGPGGPGTYSSIDGNTYGGGGGGGASNSVWPSGPIAAQGGPGGTGGSGGGGPGAPSGGGATPGSGNSGGGGGGRSVGPLGASSPAPGAPGVIVVRYPYP